MREIRPILTFVFGMFCMLAQGQKTGSKNPGMEIKEFISLGKVLYEEHCLSCHQEDGLGAGQMNPPLANTSYVLGDKPTLIKVLLNGMKEEEIDGETYYNVMPSFSYLSDAEIAHVLTYVRNSFGNEATEVTMKDVAETRKENNKK